MAATDYQSTQSSTSGPSPADAVCPHSQHRRVIFRIPLLCGYSWIMLERDWDYAFEQPFWEAVGLNFVSFPFALVSIFVGSFVGAFCVVAFFDFWWLLMGIGACWKRGMAHSFIPELLFFGISWLGMAWGTSYFYAYLQTVAGIDTGVAVVCAIFFVIISGAVFIFLWAFPPTCVRLARSNHSEERGPETHLVGANSDPNPGLEVTSAVEA